jgi:hypothetical protein
VPFLSSQSGTLLICPDQSPLMVVGVPVTLGTGHRLPSPGPHFTALPCRSTVWGPFCIEAGENPWTPSMLARQEEKAGRRIEVSWTWNHLLLQKPGAAGTSDSSLHESPGSRKFHLACFCSFCSHPAGPRRSTPETRKRGTQHCTQVQPVLYTLKRRHWCLCPPPGQGGQPTSYSPALCLVGQGSGPGGAATHSLLGTDSKFHFLFSVFVSPN